MQGVMLLLMGTADALPSAPQDRPMFMEDMSEQQLASAVSKSFIYPYSVLYALLFYYPK